MVKIRLNGYSSATSVNVDENIKIGVNSSQRELPHDYLDISVSSDAVFNSERAGSGTFKFVFTVNLLASNPLMNLDDSGSYQDIHTLAGFNYSDQYGNYRFSEKIFSQAIKNNLKEVDGWFGYYEPDTTKPDLCAFYDMEPKRSRFSLLDDNEPYHQTNNQPVTNWDVCLTYPHTVDSGHTMVNGGLLIIDEKETTIGGRAMTSMFTPVKHNLLVGDVVRLKNTNGIDGEYVVISLGYQGVLPEYAFTIDVQYGFTGINTRMQRVSGGMGVGYYFRLFRKISGSTKYDKYRLSFSENGYGDQNVQIVFPSVQPFDTYRDNLGRPLTEVHLTFIKKDGNGLFTNVSSGIGIPYMDKLTTSDVNLWLRVVPVVNMLHNGGSSPFPAHDPLESDVKLDNNNGLLGNDLFYGDVVEYDGSTLSETVLGEVMHRFNTANRQSAPTINTLTSLATIGMSATTSDVLLGARHEGYVYKPHHVVKVREMSPYIETGDANTLGVPSYAEFSDGVYRWRDCLDYGVSYFSDQSVNHPFLNGHHYVHRCVDLRVGRQDPYDQWGLYHSSFPADPFGKPKTSLYDQNQIDDVC